MRNQQTVQKKTESATNVSKTHGSSEHMIDEKREEKAEM